MQYTYQTVVSSKDYRVNFIIKTINAFIISNFREKRKEKEREDLWKRLAAVELNPPKDRDPHILSKTPLTNFTTKRELSAGYGMVVSTNSVGDKSPNFSKR